MTRARVIGVRVAAAVVLLAMGAWAAVLVWGGDDGGSAKVVFDGMRLPEDAKAFGSDVGPQGGIWKLGVSRRLTEADVGIPAGFTVPTFPVSREGSCFGFRLWEPEPEPGCRAEVVALRYGKDPRRPRERYCTLEVAQWDQRHEGRHIAVVGIHCNQLRIQLGPEMNSRLDAAG